MNRLIQSRITTISSCFSKTSVRAKHHKTPAERLPAFVRYERPDIPTVHEQNSYTEEEKLELWAKVKPSELRPPYFEFTKEERDRLGLKNIADVAYLPENKAPKHVEINADESPYNEIYADGPDQGTFTKTKNLLEEQPERWFWVQRLMPKTINLRQSRSPNEPIQTTSTGFVAPPSQPPSLPYFVPRTRNNLLPVYKIVEYKDQKAKTVVRNVSGDVWTLEDELRQVIQPLQEERILSAVNEATGEIRFMGSFEKQIADHLIKLGF